MKPCHECRKFLLVFLVVATLPALPGCVSSFDPQSVSITVSAGSGICTAPTLAQCEAMQRVADGLNAGPLAAAVAEARK